MFQYFSFFIERRKKIDQKKRLHMELLRTFARTFLFSGVVLETNGREVRERKKERERESSFQTTTIPLLQAGCPLAAASLLFLKRPAMQFFILHAVVGLKTLACCHFMGTWKLLTAGFPWR